MSDDKMRAEFEAWAKANGFSVRFSSNGSYYWGGTVQRWRVWQSAYQAGRKAEREEVDCKTEKLLAEFRILIEEVEQTGTYYENARVGAALANAWRVFDDVAAQIRNKPEGKDE